MGKRTGGLVVDEMLRSDRGQYAVGNKVKRQGCSNTEASDPHGPFCVGDAIDPATGLPVDDPEIRKSVAINLHISIDYHTHLCAQKGLDESRCYPRKTYLFS
jgi:hypothetical protein